MSWQPIESAPKDGEDILVFYTLPNGVRPDLHPPVCIAWFNPGIGWVWQGRAVRGYSFPPTHWMPLPAPPTPEASAERDGL